MTTTTPVTQTPSPPIAPVDPTLFITHLLAISGYALSGMWREAAAFLENYNSVQGNSMKLMQVSQTVQTEQMSNANTYIGILTNDQIQMRIAIDVYNDPNSKYYHDQTTLQNALTSIQGAASLTNTQYNSVNQFWSGLNNGINQTASDATQTESLDMQMFQQGILALQQQLANAM